MSLLEIPYELIYIIIGNAGKFSLRELYDLGIVNKYLWALMRPKLCAAKESLGRQNVAKKSLVAQLEGLRYNFVTRADAQNEFYRSYIKFPNGDSWIYFSTRNSRDMLTILEDKGDHYSKKIFMIDYPLDSEVSIVYI